MEDEIHAPGIYRALMRLKPEIGNPPCLIAENGPPIPDVFGANRLDDCGRASYIVDYLAQVADAQQDGWHRRVYFFWSLWDNLEE
jgi:beta-glucosidase/6-phospho-beta-glucosidase/beta-galactosidase